MKTYSKTHTSLKAANAHKAKITARGGIAVLKPEKGKYIIEYYFLPKLVNEQRMDSAKSLAKTKKYQSTSKPTQKKMYDVLDPDGKTIRLPGVPLFDTLKASNDYFDKWSVKHSRQGFWSVSKQKTIPSTKLRPHCKWIVLNVDRNSVPKKPVILFDILSPDGFTIRMPGDELFKSKAEGEKYFKQWKKRFEHQGYYSSNYGRIPLSLLHEDCSWREVQADKADSWLGFGG